MGGLREYFHHCRQTWAFYRPGPLAAVQWLLMETLNEVHLQNLAILSQILLPVAFNNSSWGSSTKAKGQGNLLSPHIQALAHFAFGLLDSSKLIFATTQPLSPRHLLRYMLSKGKIWRKFKQEFDSKSSNFNFWVLAVCSAIFSYWNFLF